MGPRELPGSRLLWAFGGGTNEWKISLSHASTLCFLSSKNNPKQKTTHPDNAPCCLSLAAVFPLPSAATAGSSSENIRSCSSPSRRGQLGGEPVLQSGVSLCRTRWARCPGWRLEPGYCILFTTSTTPREHKGLSGYSHRNPGWTTRPPASRRHPGVSSDSLPSSPFGCSRPGVREHGTEERAEGSPSTRRLRLTYDRDSQIGRAHV